MKRFYLCLLACFATVSLLAYDFQYGDLYYNITSSVKPYTVEVTSGNYSGEVIIPETVTYNGTTYSVTRIGERAFQSCSITSVTIPNSVTSIGDHAFYYCTSLASVTIGNSVTSIGDGAFGGCNSLSQTNYTGDIAGWCNLQFGDYYANPICYSNNLYINDQEVKDLVIPNTVDSIRNYAFSHCYSLTSVTIGNGVTSIGNWAFNYCKSLTTLTIGNSVTSIGNFAFRSCTSLTSITIPNSVTSIGDLAFRYCTSLTSITIPNSVTSIGDTAFYNCSSLTSIAIPNSVTSIGGGAFMDCPSLISMMVENGNTIYDSRENSNAIIETASNTLIAGCQNTIIPHSITSIGGDAFYNCGFLTSITIPNSVTSIGDRAFFSCYSLTSVTIGNSVKKIGDSAFAGCSFTSITIPNSVTRIGEAAFYHCDSLTSVTIGNSVTSIGTWAFYICPFTSITCEATTPPTLGSWAFSANKSIPVYVPCGCVSAYKAANGWKDFTNIQEPSINSIEVYTSNSQMGSAKVDYNNCAGNQITATANYGYHFVKWSDGNTDNPRTLILTQDTVLTAEFAINQYAISTTPSHKERGTTAGDTTANHLDTVTISAIANYGYHFIRWDDGNTENPRRVQVTEDKKYTAYFDKNIYQITINYNTEHGTVEGPSYAQYLDTIDRTAYANYGYHFVQWSDSVTDNPRTFVVTQDTVLTAEFAINQYAISTTPSHKERGTTAGDTTVNYLDTITISAIANYGYHFTTWSDTADMITHPIQAQIQVLATRNKKYTAYFNKNTYYIRSYYNKEQGTVNHRSSAQYLDEVTFTATANYGYHFVQWSDGVIDNPRTLILTQDTVLTAEFALTTAGQCGKNLYWVYNTNTTTLTITGSGDMYDERPWGLLANDLTEVALPSGITHIGNDAFSNCVNLRAITIPATVTTIGDQAFAGCRNLRNVNCYPLLPPYAETTSFFNYNVNLNVPCDYLEDYQYDLVFGSFKYINCISSDEVEDTEDVEIDAGQTDVTIIWPSADNAYTYTILIKKNGEVVCTLVFDAFGRLLNIAFAPGRDGNHRPVQYAKQTATGGFRFTVTGLEAGTDYTYSITSTDESDNTISSHSGEFTTKSDTSTAVENTSSLSPMTDCQKIIHENQLLILRDGKIYNVIGQEL